MQIPPYEDKFIEANGVDLHYVEKGSGPVLLFIHGFPECWYMWKKQIDFFSKSGYRCIGLDMRGCNLSDKLRGKRKYKPKILAKDIFEIIEKLSCEDVTIVTAGLGVLPTVTAASIYPKNIKALICINAPHPKAYLDCFWTPSHLNKAWYVLVHQLPLIPNILWSGFGHLGIRYYFSRLNEVKLEKDEFDAFMNAIRQPKSLSCMLHYYRNFKTILSLPQWRRNQLRIVQPTLNIYSKNHPGFSKSIIQESQKNFENSQLEVFEEGICMLQWASSQKVNSRILDFLQSTRA